VRHALGEPCFRNPCSPSEMPLGYLTGVNLRNLRNLRLKKYLCFSVESVVEYVVSVCHEKS
jgi:hypothetical protein